MPQPQKVREEVKTFYNGDDISLHELIKLWKGHLADYVISLEEVWEDHVIKLYKERDETPEEMAARIKEEEATELYYAQQRRQQYERLKKEFG